MELRRRATRSEPSTYGGPAFDPSRVLLRRVFFLNDEKSRYVSVGFYQGRNYQPLIEFGGTRVLPLVLPTDCVNVVVERVPGLLEALCRDELFAWSSDDKDFKIHSTKAYRTASMQYLLHVIVNQLNMYTEALGDVRAYVNATLPSCEYTEPPIATSKSITYRQLFDELKSPMY